MNKNDFLFKTLLIGINKEDMIGIKLCIDLVASSSIL